MNKNEIWNYVNKTGDCWIWTGAKTPDGYGQAQIEGRVRYIHRVVMGEPKGKCVLHKCDNPSCVRPDHLFVGTKGDNNRDRADKGRSNRGADRYCAKLTETKVIDARKRYKAGSAKLADLANENGVSTSAMWEAITGQCWGWVQA